MILKGIYSDDTNVCELVERYLATKTAVTHNTRAGYKTVQNILAKENFGRMRIDKVKFSDAKLFLIDLQKDGRSYSSIHSIRGVLCPAFQMAVEDEMIPYNPFSFELGKTLINDSVQREALSPKQERDLLKFVKDDPQQTKQVLDIAYKYLFIMAIFLWILYFLYVYRSALQGLGNTFIPMLSGIAEFLMRITVALLLPKLVGQDGIFFAEVTAWAGAAVLLISCYFWKITKLSRVYRANAG